MLEDMINENFRIIADSKAKNHCSKNHKYRMIL